MRTLNFRLTAVLFVVVTVIVGSTHWLHSYQLQRESSSFKIQAEAAWNATPMRYSDAVALMASYLRLRPDDCEAREELGAWYLALHKLDTASKMLEELVRALEKQNPPDVAAIQRVRWKLIDTDMQQGRCGDALYHLDVLAKELPSNAQVWNLRGKCLISLAKEEEAIKSFSEGITQRPDRVDIYANKAMALLYSPVQKKQAEAEKCMAEMIRYWDTDPASKDKVDSAEAHHVYGLWLGDELGKHDEALKQAEATLALQKDHAGALHLAGQSELALRYFDKAEEYARRGIAAAPQDAAMYTLMADVRVRNNQRDKAIQVLNDGVKACQSPGSKAQILWELANLHLDSRDAQNIAAAVDCIRRMRDYHLSPVQIAFLEARVLYDQDDWKAARAGFEKIQPKLSDPQLLKFLYHWIGCCYQQQGNPDQAMAAFRRSLSFDKFFFKARDGAAQIFLANGQLKDALEEYGMAAEGNPYDADARRVFAATLVRWNLSLSPAEQNWGGVEAVLTKIEKLSPNDGQIKLLWAEMLLNRGQARKAEDPVQAERFFAQAKSLIGALREDSPKVVEYWIAQANLAARQAKKEQANQILDEARSKLGDNVSLRLTRAVFLLRDLGLQAGAEIENLAGDADAFSTDDKVRLWNGLLNNLLEINEYDRAKQLCRQIARAQPHDATIRYRLLELALKTHSRGDSAASLAELDRVLAEIDGIAGQGPLWMYGKAVRLTLEAQQGKPELFDEAMACATKAQQMRLAWSRPHVLKGVICRQRGNNKEALAHYLQASVYGDRDPEFIRDLLQMLYEQQHYQEAKQVIERLGNNQTTREIVDREAQILSVWGEFDRALESVKRAYDPASGDYLDHVLHGQRLTLLASRAQREGHLDKLPEIARQAEEALRKACIIAPNAAECRVELVQLLMTTNQKEKACIAADDAKEMIPYQVAPLAMGYIYEALGETAKAGQSYEKALKARPNEPLTIRVLADFYVRHQNVAAATPLIQRLLSGDVQASENDLVIARRMMAVILATQAAWDYPKLKEAIELIDLNLASSLADPQDKRLKVHFLLADPRRARGLEALELMESLVMTGGAEPDPDDRFQLAKLYLARGNWERCREQMKKLVNSGQTSPLHLAAYTNMLLDRDQLEDAEKMLDRLDRVSDPGLTVALRAEWLYRKKEWGKVPEFLAFYVSQGKANKGQPERILLAAQLLERLAGRPSAPRELARNYLEQARQWYTSYVQPRPGGQMLLTGFHARRGEIEAALREIERYGEKSRPEEVFEVVDTIVSRPETKPGQLTALEGLIVALIDKTHRPTLLLVALAEIQSARDRPQDAEKIYREILRKDPRDDMACNNLSMMLALQETKLDEALELIDKTIARAGPQGAFLDTRAVVRIARHEPQRALEDLELAAAEKATPVRLFHKAWAYHSGGNAAKAKESLRSARDGGLEDSMLAGPEREISSKIAQDKN